MGSQEMPSEPLGHPLSHSLNRDTGSIGADDRVGVQVLLNSNQKVTLYLKFFDHCFDNPVNTGKLTKIIIKVSGLDDASGFRRKECSRFDLLCGLKAGIHNTI